MDNLVIRKAKVEDDYLDNLSIDEKYQKMLKNYKENGFIVAEQNNKIVGFCRYCEGNIIGGDFIERSDKI